MDVLEDDDERPLLGHRLEKAPPGGERRTGGDRRRAPTRPRGRRVSAAAIRPSSRRRCPPGRRRQPSRSFCSTSSGESCSRMPACALTISESAQSVTPSPYARQRPWRQVTSSGSASAIRDSSYTRRLLPMPGTPTSVSSCGVRSCRARSKASRMTLELALAANELRACLVRDVDTEARVRCLGFPHCDRLRLALRLDGVCVLVVDDVTASPGTWSRRRARR